MSRAQAVPASPSIKGMLCDLPVGRAGTLAKVAGHLWSVSILHSRVCVSKHGENCSCLTASNATVGTGLFRPCTLSLHVCSSSSVAEPCQPAC